MKLILLFGPQAVGKMTVGQELEKMTGLKLFHNHMSIDLVAPFFSYGTEEGKRLVNLIRFELFEAFAKSNQKGMIFTFVWALDQKEDFDYVDRICKIFEKEDSDIYFVELEANMKIRLERNITENRLRCKSTKRDTAFTERDIRVSLEKHRLNSIPGEITRGNYLHLNNEELLPEEAARIIKDTFSLS
ncbi:MAG: AAA family ATPase [Clostridiaceae bacterium]